MVDTRPRFGGSKVRSGCITCKARHVKCDEGKPHCTRCLKGGRKCEGYATPPKRRSSDQLTIINYAAPNSRSVSPYPQADPKEIRALQYFQTCTAPELSGSFSPELWNRFMLRLAYHQSSVHHAVVALGIVHEDFINGGLSDFSDYANREYGRAIRDVVDLNAAGSPDAVEIALATCILFACLESLRGHFRSSLSHLMSGLNVLEEDQRIAGPQQETCIPREILLSLFLRVDAQRIDLGGSGTTPGTMLSMIARPSIPSCFSSVEEARHQLEILYHHILQLLHRAEERSRNKCSSQRREFWHTLLEQKRALESIRQCWEHALDAMLGRGTDSEGSASRPRDPGVIVLDMANQTIKIFLHVDMIDPELDYDKYEGLFHRVVCDADEYIQKTSETRKNSTQSPFSTRSIRGSPESSAGTGTRRAASQSRQPRLLLPNPEPVSVPMFSLSLGCVSSLYFTAARCRSPRIRYRALTLLQKCNRREGLWDSNIAARIAENVIAIEEAKALETMNHIRRLSGANTMRMTGGSDFVIPENSRVKFVDLKFGPEGHGNAMYSFEDPTRAIATSGEMPSAMDTTGLGQLYEW